MAFCFNEDHVAIVDVTDKTDMELISSIHYAQVGVHPPRLVERRPNLGLTSTTNWTSSTLGHGTRTYIADVSDLDNPVVLGYYEADNTSVDHNLYVRGDKVYASNYMSGLRMSTIATTASSIRTPTLTCVPIRDTATFYGTWSNYPYFPSGNIAMSCRGWACSC